MNIFKTDIGVRSENFLIKLILATIIVFGTIFVMYFQFRI